MMVALADMKLPDPAADTVTLAIDVFSGDDPPWATVFGLCGCDWCTGLVWDASIVAEISAADVRRVLGLDPGEHVAGGFSRSATTAQLAALQAAATEWHARGGP